MSKRLVTILTPVFNEEANLPEYRRAVEGTLFDLEDYDVNILFIDDGSSDESWRIISRFCEEDSRFRALRLSRNFGSHVAISCGFDHCESDAVVTLACDLQDPPEVVAEFLERWRRGAHIVWGHRRRREDRKWRTVLSSIFEKAMRKFAMPKGSKFATGSFFLVDAKVASCYRRFREHNRITFALMAWTGFEQDEVHYVRPARKRGVSGWTFGGMFKAMYDAFIGFSSLPIRLMTYIGLGVSVANFFFLMYLLSLWWSGNPIMGWTSVMFTITLFFGVQFLLMGMVGEYMSRIYTEVINRPLYFVSDMHNLPRESQ